MNSDAQHLLKIVLKDPINGVTMLNVNPNSLISSLRVDKNNQNIFLYNGVTLMESMSFRFYSISDGDIIYSINPHVDISKFSKLKQKHMQEIRLEKYKLIDRTNARMFCNPELYRRKESNLLEEIMFMDRPFSFMIEPPFLSPRKMDKPATSPLPAFWTM